MTTAPRPAERLAALSALKAGIDELIAEARDEVLDTAADASVRSFETPFGQVNVTRREPAIAVTDEDALLAHVKATRPDEVATAEFVRPAYVKALLTDLVVVAGHVIHKDTAEVVEWAGVTAEGAPFVSWPRSARQVEAKALATATMRQAATDAIEALRRGVIEP